MSEPNDLLTVLEHELPVLSGLRIGDYELLTKLAAGGMGEVFIARSKRAPDRRVALKLLLPHLSNNVEFVQMFLDEARIAARMNHPNIVPIFDLGQAGGRYYLAMALIEGVSLKALLTECRKRGLQLPMPVVEHIAAGLCAGLDYAHRLKGPDGQAFDVIHRDVTPHNVLLSVTGEVLLTDFGIAKAHGNLHHTRVGTVRGKYAYLAPEQLQTDEKVDRRADLFSAAVTLFEAFTLVSPFARASEIEIVEALRTAVVPDAATLRPLIDPAVAAAFRKATQRDPAKRYSSALELRDALVRGPTGAAEQLGSWVENFCSLQLKPFHGLPSLEVLAEQPTRSLVEVSVTAADPRPSAVALRTEPEGVSAPQLRTESLGEPPRGIARMLGLGAALGLLFTSGALWIAMRSVRLRAPAAEETSPLGYLTLEVSPGARVSIDGAGIEATALSRYPLSAGEHLVVIRDPVLGRTAERIVHIEKGQAALVQMAFDR